MVKVPPWHKSTEKGAKMKQSKHSKIRCQQRCIPPIVHDWLSEFGKENYVGYGAVKVFFHRDSIRAMRKKLGRHFVQQNKKYMKYTNITNIQIARNILYVIFSLYNS